MRAESSFLPIFDICDSYAEAVINGVIPSGKLMILAAKRWKSDVKSGKFKWEEEYVSEKIGFIEGRCIHWEGPLSGQPVQLEYWQIFYYGNIWGWWDKDGTRRFQESYLQVARKNGKTYMAAVQALNAVSDQLDGSPHVIVTANKEEQAGLCVNSAGMIVEKSSRFKTSQARQNNTEEFSLHWIHSRCYKVKNNRTNGLIQTMGRDDGRNDGFNPSEAIVDEYHEAKDAGALNVLRSGMGARANPMLSVITTAGFNKGGVCYDLRTYCIKILEGHVENDTTFAMIFEMDAGDDWMDPDVWKKCNPNLGVSVSQKWLAKEARAARDQGGQHEVSFRTKNMNQWTESESVWINEEEIRFANQYEFKLEEFRHRPVWCGIDLAKNRDINALALMSPNLETGKIDVYWRYYMPEDQAKKAKDGVDYLRWAGMGLINLTPGNVISHEYISADVKKMKVDYEMDIKGIVYDKWMAESHGTVHRLLEFHWDCRPLQQTHGYLSTPTKELEALLLRRDLNFHNPVSSWMFSNVVITIDSNGNIKCDKAKSQHKIDGVSALVNAVWGWAEDTHREVEIDDNVYSFDL